MFDLTGKTALVTGASGGIGGAIAKALHAQGATVALSGTRREALEKVAAELGDRTHVLPCDLGDPAATDALVKDAEAAMGTSSASPRSSASPAIPARRIMRPPRPA
jgi:3-oxoacyl-[acyl-carrier protein] reductase